MNPDNTPATPPPQDRSIRLTASGFVAICSRYHSVIDLAYRELGPAIWEHLGRAGRIDAFFRVNQGHANRRLEMAGVHVGDLRATGRLACDPWAFSRYAVYGRSHHEPVDGRLATFLRFFDALEAAA